MFKLNKENSTIIFWFSTPLPKNIFETHKWGKKKKDRWKNNNKEE